ncbi:MAG: hypothetical protein AB1758_36395, partial [Candidatus Eremiobacterota bacterium]
MPAIPDAQKYNVWLQRQVQAGRRVVILGDIGSAADSTFKGQADPGPALAALGLKFTPYVAPPRTIKSSGSEDLDLAAPTRPAAILKLDPTMCNYEQAIDMGERELLRAGWPLVRSTGAANKVYLCVQDYRGDSDVVVVTPSGGVALGTFPSYVPEARPLRSESLPPGANPSQYAAAEETPAPAWRINPFLFFSQALDTDSLPRPDLSTLNGSRLYWSHIDGDASAGISLIDRTSLNSEMLYREILSRTRLPFSVSYVTRDLSFKAKPYYTRELDAARQILALPNVETACHTETHPFDWVKGDSVLVDGKLQKQLPRLSEEITHSLDFTNQLVAPRDKPTRILLWTGLCNPQPEALALLDSLGVANMNGGDPVYDATNPFVAGIYPVYSRVGDRIQYHTAAAGDFYYTYSWTRDYDGMKKLVGYFEKTEKPYRLRPMNVYFHFYLAERAEGLAGLRAVFDYVQKQPIAPLFASQYPAIVNDFVTLRVGRDPEGAILVHNSGSLRTIRLDNLRKHVDLNRSQGVIGYLIEDSCLYVHLDGSNKHRIFLQDQTPSRVYLI